MQLALKDFEIFDSIQKQSQCIVTATRMLKGALRPDGSGIDTSASQIQKVSALQGELLINALEHLDHKLVTTIPFGREDVLRVLYRLRDVMHALNQVAYAIMRLRAHSIPTPLLRLREILSSCSVALVEAIDAFGASTRVTEHVVTIDRLTFKAIQVAMQSMEELMSGETDLGVEVEHLNNIYRLVERVAFSFNEVARAMEDASLKHCESLVAK